VTAQTNTNAARGAEVQSTAATRQPTATTAEIISQIVEKMKVDLRPMVNEIRISLKPAHLGDVSVRISTRDGAVAAQIVAGSDQVRAILEADLNRLRDALNELGINVQELQVSVGQNSESGERNADAESGRSVRRIGEILDAMDEDMDVDLEAMQIGPDNTVSYTA